MNIIVSAELESIFTMYCTEMRVFELKKGVQMYIVRTLFQTSYSLLHNYASKEPPPLLLKCRTHAPSR